MDTYIRDVFVKEQLKYIRKSFDTVYVISPVAYGLDYLRKTQYEDYSFDNVHVFFPKYFNFPLFYKYGREFWVKLEAHAISKLLKKQNIKFDIIHAHFTWPSGAVAVELKKKLGVPVVITEHTSTTFQKAIDRKDPIFIHSWQMSDAIIRVRKSDISLMGDVGINLEKVHHVPNGYDQKKFYPLDKQLCREKLGLPRDKKIILYVGSLYGDVKGHFYLIEAMEKIVSKKDDVFCYIVGDGILRKKLERQISSSNLQKHVTIVGSKPHHEVPLWMNACDVFVLPSLNEGNPTVLVECLSCGKPFVGTRVGGVPEIITSDDFGFLVKPGNSLDLAEKINLSLDINWNEDKIVNHAERYSWEVITEQILDIYMDLQI
ncbi:glycosyltransferase family 4 protein [Methanococcoides orientis]|uniref:glycosyltransferase family 4 protein n=1 Tax=Methanococcoides orientis TaxID=2822137 RepID=UPI001E334D48|nr:glycosyltransferase family 4 protein [Methanococcoides orientis]